MIIEKQNPINFGQLKIGDVFTLNGHVYLKTYHCVGTNTVNLSNNRHYTIHNDEVVELKKARLILE